MEPRNNGEKRGALKARSISLLLFALVLAAILAPAGEAQSAVESSPEAQTLIASQRVAAREERAAAKRAAREAKLAERVPNEKLLKARSNERTNGVVLISCTQVTWTFREFPNLPGNAVVEKLKVNRVATSTTFTFDGSSGSNVTPIDAPPGSYIIDAQAKWRKPSANGASGSFDIHAKVKCEPNPAMSVEKLQRIEGNGSSYTSTPQTGEVGQTIGYEILVSNTGNVPLTIGAFTDPRCDPSSITGGPPGGVIAPATTSAYLCKHTLTAADLTVGSYANTVMLTGTPPEGDGTLPSETSNTVVTEVKPAAPPEKQPEKEPTKTTTSSTTTPTSGTLASTAVQSPGKSGVLAFSSGTIPSLKGLRARELPREHQVGGRGQRDVLPGRTQTAQDDLAQRPRRAADGHDRPGEADDRRAPAAGEDHDGQSHGGCGGRPGIARSDGPALPLQRGDAQVHGVA
jgi:hypothetical protein